MMRRVSPRPLRRRQIDRQFSIEIGSGALWGYNPGTRSRRRDAIGGIVDQHWDAVLENRTGSGLALATSLRSLDAATSAEPCVRALLDEAERLVALGMLAPPSEKPIGLLVVDGRCLQHPDFARRGIGRLARFVVGSLVERVPTLPVVVMSDDSLPPIESSALDRSVAQLRRSEVLSLVDSQDSAGLAVLDPAPMTHPPSEFDHFPARRIAVVHDFVPLHAPDVYLPTSNEQLTYLIRLLRLRRHDQFWCNSGATAAETAAILQDPNATIGVLPPPAPLERGEPSRPETVAEPFFFAPVGADRRKNLPAAISTLAHRAQRGWPGNLIVLSHMPDPHRKELNDLADASGLDSDRIIVVSDLSDAEIIWLFEHAEVAIIPSFDEGLSLPLLEAIDAGCPVVASDIPPHRELLGDDEVLCDPARPSQFADRIEFVVANRASALERQRAAIDLARRRHSFDDIVDLLGIR